MPPRTRTAQWGAKLVRVTRLHETPRPIGRNTRLSCPLQKKRIFFLVHAFCSNILLCSCRVFLFSPFAVQKKKNNKNNRHVLSRYATATPFSPAYYSFDFFEAVFRVMTHSCNAKRSKNVCHVYVFYHINGTN